MVLMQLQSRIQGTNLNVYTQQNSFPFSKVMVAAYIRALSLNLPLVNERTIIFNIEHFLLLSL